MENVFCVSCGFSYVSSNIAASKCPKCGHKNGQKDKSGFFSKLFGGGKKKKIKQPKSTTPKLSNKMSKEEVDDIKEKALNLVGVKETFIVVDLLSNKQLPAPKLLPLKKLKFNDLNDYHDASLIPVVVCISESANHNPAELCMRVIMSIPDITIYKQTQVIYHSLPCALSLLEVNNKKVDPMDFIAIHSLYAPVKTIRGSKEMRVHTKMSKYWIREDSKGMNVYVYHCVLSK